MSYANRLDVKRYLIDKATRAYEEDPIKRNVQLGQFELWPERLVASSGSFSPYSVTVAKIPERFGMVSSPSNTTLLSATLPDGRVVNWHSGAPGRNLARQIESDLSGGDVLPVMAQ